MGSSRGSRSRGGLDEGQGGPRAHQWPARLAAGGPHQARALQLSAATHAKKGIILFIFHLLGGSGFIWAERVALECIALVYGLEKSESHDSTLTINVTLVDTTNG